jgi:CSLREA domain-containing protein
MKLRGLARLALVILPVAGAAGTAALPQMARAATTIIVTTFADNPSANCTGSNGCSLRRAVIMANGDTGDVIQLGAGTYDLSIQADSEGNDDGTTGDLEIQSDMTIQGAGATQTLIRGVGSPWNDRIIEVDNASAAPTATIQDLKVTGGNDTGQYGETDGGAILNDFSSLTLHNVIADTNHSDTNGGGAASDTSSAETFTISNSTLSNNTADGNGGGLSVGGSTSGVDSASRLFIVGNTANGSNQADAGGGGIYDDIGGTGSIAFSDIMVVGNHAPNMSGGGIYENSFGGLTPKSSYKNLTVSGNDAQFAGGGFYVAGALTSLTNATITGNSTTGQVSASNIGGGGIAGGQSGSVTVNNATINGNTSTTQGGGVAAIDRGDHIHLHNTIVVKNTVLASSSDCFVGGFGTAIDSTGYNIVDDSTCALGQASDREGSSFNPNLGVLQDNTGPLDGAPGDTSPTLTEALPTGSIAIDTADPAGANNPATDERGVSRPQGIQSDVGAYEAIPPVFVAPILPAAGNAGSGSQSSTFWLLLILAAATALGAVGLRVRARS